MAGPKSQHRSGRPVHQPRLHRRAGGRGHTHLDGQSRTLDGRRVHRTALWHSLKYECVFLNAFDRRPGPNRHRSLDRLLQPAAAALGAGRQDARRGLCYRNPAGEFGGLKPAGPHLSKAANLSQRPSASSTDFSRKRAKLRTLRALAVRLCASTPRSLRSFKATLWHLITCFHHARGTQPKRRYKESVPLLQRSQREQPERFG